MPTPDRLRIYEWQGDWHRKAISTGAPGVDLGQGEFKEAPGRPPIQVSTPAAGLTPGPAKRHYSPQHPFLIHRGDHHRQKVYGRRAAEVGWPAELGGGALRVQGASSPQLPHVVGGDGAEVAGGQVA
jgi:hypothetical protein